MKEAFVSCFASDLELFVMKKQEAGFHYGSQVHILRQFDGFCAGQEISIPEVTRELVEAWLSSFKNCCAVTMSGKASAIRQFSLFLLANGKNAYIPGQKTHGKQRHIHVLSDEEIRALFVKIDQYSPRLNCHSFNRLALEYRVLFRLLLCCGMRVSEARKLKKEDVDLVAGTVIIKNGKNNKDRMVYLPDDLRQLMISYSDRMRKEYNDWSLWFFPAREMGKCPDKPTVHSLRHTFVVKRMNLWMEEGVPLRSMLPYLSKYLGHKSVEDTFYYYHQVDTAFRIVRDKDKKSGVIIPEVAAIENSISE